MLLYSTALQMPVCLASALRYTSWKAAYVLYLWIKLSSILLLSSASGNMLPKGLTRGLRHQLQYSATPQHYMAAA
jgi:hypothetical protein